MEFPVKRGREETEMETANYLVLLSKIAQTDFVTKSHVTGRTYTCKTCNKKFPSFQALGGHRASHKKPKFAGDDLLFKLPNSLPKPKTHECTICGVEFPIGQALGGHMRKHKAATTTAKTDKDNSNMFLISSNTTSSATSNSSMVSNGEELGIRDVFPSNKTTVKSSCKIFGVDLSVAASSTLKLFV